MRTLRNLALVSFLVGSTAFAAGATPAKKKSLYERLGKKEAITAVVGDFLNNVAADKRINSFFAKTNIADLKGKLINQICEASGGPCKYQGLDMKTAHSSDIIGKASAGKHTKVSDADFGALVEDLVKSLDKFKVKKTEKDELLGALGGMKGDSVQP